MVLLPSEPIYRQCAVHLREMSKSLVLAAFVLWMRSHRHFRSGNLRIRRQIVEGNLQTRGSENPQTRGLPRVDQWAPSDLCLTAGRICHSGGTRRASHSYCSPVIGPRTATRRAGQTPKTMPKPGGETEREHDRRNTHCGVPAQLSPPMRMVSSSSAARHPNKAGREPFTEMTVCRG